MTLKKQRVGKVFKVYAITSRLAENRAIFLIAIAYILTLFQHDDSPCCNDGSITNGNRYDYAMGQKQFN
ncbi:hypothetical protein RTE01_21270 [Raoultella terrigena]|nr:hypothetical protein RTE01_21270 [Raoultella terrigena]